MKKVALECMYFKDNFCTNAKMSKLLENTNNKCVLVDKPNTEKVVTVCKLRTNARLVDGFFVIQ